MSERTRWAYNRKVVASVKHALVSLFVSVINEQPKDGSADADGQQSRRHLNPDDMFFLCLQSAKAVLRLQLTAQQFDDPPSTVQRYYLLGTEPTDRQVRDVLSIAVVGVRIADADDSEPLASPRFLLGVLSPFEPYSDLDVDVLSTQIVSTIEDISSFERNDAAAPVPQFSDDHWNQTPHQFADKEADVLVDLRDSLELEKVEIQQE